MRARAKYFTWEPGPVHPSSMLRAPDPATRTREPAAFTDDLRVVAEQLDLRSA